MKRALLVLLVLLVLPATALAAPKRERGDGGVEEARHAHGATRPPERVAGGAITGKPTEGLAGVLRTVRVTLAPGQVPVALDYPDRFQRRALNGRAYVKGLPTGRTLDGADRSVAIDVSGLPAGTYRLPVRRGGARIGTAVFRLYAQRKEGEEEEEEPSGPFGGLGRVPVDSSGDSTEESETFIAVEPDNGLRIASYGNDIGPSAGTGGLNVTNDGGSNWSHLTFPLVFDLKAPGTVELENPGGDPILAADANGNIWAGGLSTCTTATTSSHIFVNRVAGPSGLATSSTNVALPYLHGGGICNTNSELIQDKPQMTINNAAGPTFGRLYVVWDDPDPSGGTNLVVSYCNTQPTPSFCDSADNWTDPVIISDLAGGGSYISSHVTVGPDGKVYVVWWDYSAANAIAIDTCDPAAHAGHCNLASDWSTDKVVASLSVHEGRGVPFACPTVAQPGGRAAPAPSAAVDHSGGSNNGRIYVSWSDLTTAGAHRCTGLSDTPQADQDAFRSYVASAPDYPTLTANPSTRSYERGTNIIGDAGDHWFPWVAVDQSTGQAYVDLYSTRDDVTRKTAKFYARAVVPGAGSTRVSYGPLTPVSADATNYSDKQCCQFGNDYGDYTGLDAAGGSIFAVWTHRLLGGDGDVYVNVLSPLASPTEVPSDDAVPVVQPPPPPPTTTTETTPPPPPTTTTTTTTTTPSTPPRDLTPPILKVTFATRVDRKGRYTVKLAPAGEPASGNATLRLATGKRRKLASGLLATSGNKPLKLVIRLKKKDLRLLKRKHKLRVRLTVSLTDLAGNTARGSKTFTLRLRR